MALQSLESNPQLSFATRMEDWTSLGQHKRHPEFPVVTRESRRNSRKTKWFPRHRKMKPFPATALRRSPTLGIGGRIGTWHPSLGGLPDPGIEPGSSTLQADSFPSEPPGKPSLYNALAQYSQKKCKYESLRKGSYKQLVAKTIMATNGTLAFFILSLLISWFTPCSTPGL